MKADLLNCGVLNIKQEDTKYLDKIGDMHKYGDIIATLKLFRAERIKMQSLAEKIDKQIDTILDDELFYRYINQMNRRITILKNELYQAYKSIGILKLYDDSININVDRDLARKITKLDKWYSQYNVDAIKKRIQIVETNVKNMMNKRNNEDFLLEQEEMIAYLEDSINELDQCMYILNGRLANK